MLASSYKPVQDFIHIMSVLPRLNLSYIQMVTNVNYVFEDVFIKPFSARNFIDKYELLIKPYINI